MDVLNYNLDQIEVWVLMLFRISSTIMVLPFFGFTNFPVVARIAFAFTFTTLLFPLHQSTPVVFESSVLGYFGIIVAEIMLGLAIGMVGNFLFYGFQFAGHIVGYSMGFGIISVMDPQSEVNVPLISQVLNLLALALFIIAGGHHFLLMAIDESFLRIPLGGIQFNPEMVEGFARLSADIFIIGMKVGAPVLVAILVMEFALGIIARTVPQMNVWMVGFPLKIGIGLFTLGTSLPFVVFIFGKLYSKWQGNFIDFIHSMTG